MAKPKPIPMEHRYYLPRANNCTTAIYAVQYPNETFFIHIGGEVSLQTGGLDGKLKLLKGYWREVENINVYLTCTTKKKSHSNEHRTSNT